MSRTGLLRLATAAVAASAAIGVSADADAAVHQRARADHGTAAVATTPLTSGLNQYVAGFDSDAVLGHGAITYLIKAVPTSAQGTFSLVAHSVVLYTRAGELSGTATATLTATAGGHASVTGGKLRLNAGTGSLAGHSLTARFFGAGQLGGGYAFTYHGTYR
jgi:hypothetical protein